MKQPVLMSGNEKRKRDREADNVKRKVREIEEGRRERKKEGEERG